MTVKTPCPVVDDVKAQGEVEGGELLDCDAWNEQQGVPPSSMSPHTSRVLL